jgi:hypothetical protein
MLSLRAGVHLLLHALVPCAVAAVARPRRPGRALLLMLAGWAVDVDHLLAHHVYNPDRCSIGFHPLHRTAAQVVYVALTLHPRSRWLGLGLLLHMALDSVDCLAMVR